MIFLKKIFNIIVHLDADNDKIWLITRYASREVLDLLLDPNIVQNPRVV